MGGGGVLLSWNTNPGPEDLGGYKIEKRWHSENWQSVTKFTRETTTIDPNGVPGTEYRLFGINGLGQELLLGQTTFGRSTPLQAGPLPFRGGNMQITFASDGGSLNTEVALYDLVGQHQGTPISELLGGRVRDRILLYGSGGMYMPPEDYAAEAAAVQSLGFSAYKMRPGLGPEEDLRTVKLMREATGAAFDLMVDAHTWWRMGDRSYGPEISARMAADLAEFDITWLEEPLPPDDHQAYAKLKASASVPIASGEHEPSDDGFLDLILTQAVDYVQMDVCCQGGYALGRRLFAEVARQGLSFAFHSWGSALEVMAAAHLGICWPESTSFSSVPVHRNEPLERV